MNFIQIRQGEDGYPAAINKYLGNNSPESITALGNTDKIFVAYAEPQSKTEQFCRKVLAWGKPLYTLESNSNANLITMGAKPVDMDNISVWLKNTLGVNQ